MAAVQRWDQVEDWRPTRAQETTAWDMAGNLADHGGGCFVRSLDDGRDELLMMHRGAFRQYFISQDGQAMLAASAPRTSRYPWSRGLCFGGTFFFLVIVVGGGLVFGGPNGEIPGFIGIPAVIAFGMAFIGVAMAPRLQPPASEGWTKLAFSDNG